MCQKCQIMVQIYEYALCMIVFGVLHPKAGQAREVILLQQPQRYQHFSKWTHFKKKCCTRLKICCACPMTYIHKLVFVEADKPQPLNRKSSLVYCFQPMSPKRFHLGRPFNYVHTRAKFHWSTHESFRKIVLQRQQPWWYMKTIFT